MAHTSLHDEGQKGGVKQGWIRSWGPKSSPRPSLTLLTPCKFRSQGGPQFPLPQFPCSSDMV